MNVGGKSIRGGPVHPEDVAAFKTTTFAEKEGGNGCLWRGVGESSAAAMVGGLRGSVAKINRKHMSSRALFFAQQDGGYICESFFLPWVLRRRRGKSYGRRPLNDLRCAQRVEKRHTRYPRTQVGINTLARTIIFGERQWDEMYAGMP